MTALEKFNVVFNQTNWLLPGAYVIILVKILSLSIYAILVFKMYKASKEQMNEKNKAQFCWQRNLIGLYLIYIIAYVVYAANLVKFIDFPVLFHLQILVMVGVVFYVSYIVYEQPEIFKGKIRLVDPMELFKYKKSGLTTTYSLELRDALLQLFNEDRIYKNNKLNLEFLSKELGTTRHNASQVINEHFDMNFFELVNSYRIKEAQELLQQDKNSNLTIIEVAYEVGFNNKVTFNKSFKKQVSLTPSEYVKSLRV
jgi:AraC-like DNA-binding protein